MILNCDIFFIAVLVKTVFGDNQFKSRPDLSAPRLNITIPAEGTSPGFLFSAPFSGFADNKNHGPRQAAPYIFTDRGELVWSGFSYFSIWATNFQYGRVDGRDFLFSFEGSHNPSYGHGHGHITFLDHSYETVKELRAGKHKIIDKHEFHIIGEKTGLVQIYQPVLRDLTAYGGSARQQWIVNAIFQEIDLKSGRVLFEWSSLDWVSPDESVLPITEEQAGGGFNSSDAWDYFHINSVDKDSEGNYLLSARDASALYKVNGTNGEILWKLAGLSKISNSSFESNFSFSFQHHARFLETRGPIQTISFYDNSAHGSEDKNGKTVEYSKTSSGKIIEIDTSAWTAVLLKEYLPPDDLLSKSQGSTQVLPNGNVLVNWGSEGAVTEYNHDGKPIFHAYFDSGDLGRHVENYRAFKFNWTGVPNEDIAIVSQSSQKKETFIYVSWNGDTRTKLWKFFSVEDDGKRILLGEKKRTGFETSFKIANKIVPKILAVSLDKDGIVLGTSDISKTEIQIPIFEEERSFSLISYFDWKKKMERGNCGFFALKSPKMS